MQITALSGVDNRYKPEYPEFLIAYLNNSNSSNYANYITKQNNWEKS